MSSSKRKAEPATTDSKEEALEKKTKDEPIDLTSEEEEEEDRLQTTSTYWTQLETAHKTAQEFEKKEFPRVKRIITIGGFILPWNEDLLVTRDRRCTSDDCHTDNDYPGWGLELLKCFTKGGAFDCTVQVTYEPIERMIYLHWDRCVMGKYKALDHCWVQELEQELKRIAKRGKGFTSVDPRQ